MYVPAGLSDHQAYGRQTYTYSVCSQPLSRFRALKKCANRFELIQPRVEINRDFSGESGDQKKSILTISALLLDKLSSGCVL